MKHLAPKTSAKVNKVVNRFLWSFFVVIASLGEINCATSEKSSNEPSRADLTAPIDTSNDVALTKNMAADKESSGSSGLAYSNLARMMDEDVSAVQDLLGKQNEIVEAHKNLNLLAHRSRQASKKKDGSRAAENDVEDITVVTLARNLEIARDQYYEKFREIKFIEGMTNWNAKPEPRYEENLRAIRNAIEANIRRAKEHDLRTCFLVTQKKFQEDERCIKEVAERCSIFEIQNGQLSVLWIGTDLKQDHRTIDSEDAYSQLVKAQVFRPDERPSPTAVGTRSEKITYNFCQAAADFGVAQPLRSVTSPSLAIDIYWPGATISKKTSPFWMNFAIQEKAGLSDETAIHYDLVWDACLKWGNLKELEEKLVGLIEETKTLDNSTLRLWLASLRIRKDECIIAVSQACAHTYKLKDKIILTYPTTSCDVRSVTVSDIEADMLSFATEADRAEHSTLLDLIGVCARADQEGYSWMYRKPVHGPKCKPKKNRQ